MQSESLSFFFPSFLKPQDHFSNGLTNLLHCNDNFPDKPPLLSAQKKTESPFSLPYCLSCFTIIICNLKHLLFQKNILLYPAVTSAYLIHLNQLFSTARHLQSGLLHRSSIDFFTALLTMDYSVYRGHIPDS